MKSKKQLLFLIWKHTLTLYALFLHARLGAKIKLRTRKIVRYELNLARPEISKEYSNQT